jgi:hypothetical protein
MSCLDHNPDRRLLVADVAVCVGDTAGQAAAGAAGSCGRSDRRPA